MYTKIGVELFARGIRYTIGFAMTYTEELARGYTYTARACEGVYGIQRLTVYPYHPLGNVLHVVLHFALHTALHFGFAFGLRQDRASGQRLCAKCNSL